MTTFQTYRKTLGPDWPHVIGVVLLKAASGMLEVTGLVYLVHLVGSRFASMPTGRLADLPAWEARVFGGPPSPTLQISFFLALSFGAILFKHGSRIWLGMTVVRVEHRLRRRMVECSIELSWEKFIGMRLGQFHESVLGRSQQGVYAVQSCIDFLSDLVSGLVFLGVSLWISPTITLLLVGLLLMMGTFFGSLKTRSGDSLRKVPIYIRRLTRDLEGIINSLKYLKAAGLSEHALGRYLHSLREHSEAHRHLYFYRGVPEALLDMATLSILGTLLALTLVFQWIPFTVAVTFLAIFYRLAPRLQLGFSNFLHIRAREPILRDLNKLLDRMTKNKDRSRGSRTVTLNRCIEFDRVAFHYRSGENRFQLSEVNLKIEWGQCIALVGTSGGGKSTFVDLLCGLFPPKSGHIRVDGTDLEQIDPNFWGRQVGLVLQNTPIVHGSLLENVALGDGTPNEKWAETCLRMANLSPLLDSPGVGLETVVGQQGYRLSGGQQQRVALARALYRRPRLLILDEATSALDSETEESFQHELERLRGSLCIVMVAHRLKTVKMADEILVVENGKIHQRGPWDQLIMNTDGRFFELARRQGVVSAHASL